MKFAALLLLGLCAHGANALTCNYYGQTGAGDQATPTTACTGADAAAQISASTVAAATGTGCTVSVDCATATGGVGGGAECYRANAESAAGQTVYGGCLGSTYGTMMCTDAGVATLEALGMSGITCAKCAADDCNGAGHLGTSAAAAMLVAVAGWALW